MVRIGITLVTNEYNDPEDELYDAYQEQHNGGDEPYGSFEAPFRRETPCPFMITMVVRQRKECIAIAAFKVVIVTFHRKKVA